MPPRTIYIATSNPGKLRDFAAAAQLPVVAVGAISIAPLPCLDRIPSPPETEVTFEGNARAKALYYSRLAPGFDIIADDSGIEVDALDGSPGVRSARYAADNGFAETGKTDLDNNLLLLQTLSGRRGEERTARYRCVLALARDGEVIMTAEGAVEGWIAENPQGSGGFGYDPLFYLPEFDKTMAEIDVGTRTTLTHRGRALRALLEKLQAASPE